MYSRTICRYPYLIAQRRLYSKNLIFKHRRTSLPRNYQHPPRVVFQSDSSSTLAVAAITASFLGVAAVIYEQLNTHPEVGQGTAVVDFQGEEERAVMAGTPLPGRPGNLTTDQEEKLKEFWSAVLQVFGVPDIANGDSTSIDGSESVRARASTLGSEKKKNRKNFFGRKINDETADGADGISGMEGEDKYGQTKQFHKLLESQSPEKLRRAFWSMVKHDNPDGLLLRFLRARKWHVQNALVMMVATMHWRLTEMKVDDDIVRRGEGGAADDSASPDAAIKREGHDFLQQMRMGKSFLHGTDKEGRPMCFVRVRLHKQGEQTESAVERYTVYTIETARLLLHGNVDTAAVVFDMTDFSMANMDYGPVKFMIKCFEANYPESLGVVLVHKSPWIFQRVWKIIKGWLDPVVAAKVHFTKNVTELSEFVSMDHITEELGGKETWQYSYKEPTPEENDTMKGTDTRDRLLEARAAVVKEYETTTQQWMHGSKDAGVLRRRKDLADKLRSGYWELDPYLRATTYYDRTGMINPGGRIQFYPVRNDEKVLQNGGPIPAGHTDDGVD